MLLDPGLSIEPYLWYASLPARKTPDGGDLGEKKGDLNAIAIFLLNHLSLKPQELKLHRNQRLSIEVNIIKINHLILCHADEN